jgi:DNA replication protein DnaC
MSQLQTTLRQLRLSGLARTLDVRLQEASAGRLGHGEFLELILQDELNVRRQRQLERRTKAADFRALKTVEDFDWQFNPSIRRAQIFELAAGSYLREGKDILFLGPPGVGKTHLAQALGYEAIKQGKEVLYRSIFDLVRDFLRDEAFSQQDKTLRRYLKPDLVIIDDMGLKALPKQSGEYLFGIQLQARQGWSLRSLGRWTLLQLLCWLGARGPLAQVVDKFDQRCRRGLNAIDLADRLRIGCQHFVNSAELGEEAFCQGQNVPLGDAVGQ